MSAIVMSTIGSHCESDTGATEPSDCGLEVAEDRLCVEIVSTMRDSISVWAQDFAEMFYVLSDRIEAEWSSRPSDTGVAVPMGRGGSAEEYSVDAVVARSLSDTTESSESFCALCSVLERGLRATVRHHTVGLGDDVERRILYEWLQIPHVASHFNSMFQGLNHLWWEDAPAAVVDLCSELLEDPRVRAGLGEVAGRLPASGALCPRSLDATLCGYYLQHAYQWLGGGGAACEHCVTVCDLRLRFAVCEDSRRVEASLARVRSAILQGVARLYPPRAAPGDAPPVAPSTYALVCGVILDACMHRVRVLLLHRVGVTRAARIAAHRWRQPIAAD